MIIPKNLKIELTQAREAYHAAEADLAALRKRKADTEQARVFAQADVEAAGKAMAGALTAEAVAAAESALDDAQARVRRFEVVLRNMEGLIAKAQDRERAARTAYSNLRSGRAPEMVREQAQATLERTAEFKALAAAAAMCGIRTVVFDTWTSESVAAGEKLAAELDA
jgi:hypothetical protein